MLYNWRDANQIEGYTAMIDRAEIRCTGFYLSDYVMSERDVADSLLLGRTPFGERLPRGFVWKNGGGIGCRKLQLRAPGALSDLITAKVTLRAVPEDPNRLSVVADVTVNPSRVRARMGELSWGEWYSSARTCPEPRHRRGWGGSQDNMLPEALLLNPGANYRWADDAADIIDRFVGILRNALFAARPGTNAFREEGYFRRVSIRQAQSYWEFRSADPGEDVLYAEPAVQGGGDAGRRMWEYRERGGVSVVTAPLTKHSTLEIYPRPGRVRAEIRYHAAVANTVRGAGHGDIQSRLRCIADDAATRLNRVLQATAVHRRRDRLVGMGGRDEFWQSLGRVIDRDRRRAVADSLLRHRSIQAGADCLISQSEALSLRRREVLVRAPIRFRDVGGRRFALHPRFNDLPRSIALL